MNPKCTSYDVDSSCNSEPTRFKANFSCRSNFECTQCGLKDGDLVHVETCHGKRVAWVSKRAVLVYMTQHTSDRCVVHSPRTSTAELVALQRGVTKYCEYRGLPGRTGTKTQQTQYLKSRLDDMRTSHLLVSSQKDADTPGERSNFPANEFIELARKVSLLQDLRRHNAAGHAYREHSELLATVDSIGSLSPLVWTQGGQRAGGG
jgi:hypothetical protein